MKDISEAFEEWYNENSLILFFSMTRGQAFELFESAYLKGEQQ